MKQALVLTLLVLFAAEGFCLRCFECEGAATVDVCDSYECGGGRDVCYAVRRKEKHGIWKYNRECGYSHNKHLFYKKCDEEPGCKLYSCASDSCNNQNLHPSIMS